MIINISIKPLYLTRFIIQMSIIKNIHIVLLASLILLSCAKPVRPTGGPKDITAPKIVEKKSTPNYQTGFFPKKIVLYFDEWITLKNKNQILISPPLNKQPKITFRGKHVTVEFDEDDTLKQNTTYTINFGKSVADFTEGNPVKDFVYIFSTGDEIDSLEIQGKVMNSFDDKPVKDVTVMLYDTDEDSIVVKSKPYYFASTDKSGKFKISHIKEGYFKVFALKDDNANYLYDKETEQIGYLDTMIFVTDDSLKKEIVIKMFTPRPQLKIVDKSVAGFGKIKINYNREPDNADILYSSVKVLDKEIAKDSLLIWYDNSEKNDSINLVIKSEERMDTMIFKIRKQYKKPIPLVLLNKEKSIKQHPDEYYTFRFNQAYYINDSSKISIQERIIKENKDTSSTAKFDTSYTNIDLDYNIDSTNAHNLNFKGNWKEDKSYKFMILPGFIKSLYDVENDTIELNIKINKKEDYSNLICHLDSLNDKKVYIVNLMKDKEILRKNIIKNKNKKDIEYKALFPGKYILEVIVDTNNNGKWDDGDYFKKQKAEKRYSFKLNELKANWSQEENIILKSKIKNDIKK